MSEHCYIDRGDLFETIEGSEVVNDAYLLYLINLVVDRLERRASQEGDSDPD